MANASVSVLLSLHLGRCWRTAGSHPGPMIPPLPVKTKPPPRAPCVNASTRNSAATSAPTESGTKTRAATRASLCLFLNSSTVIIALFRTTRPPTTLKQIHFELQKHQRRVVMTITSSGYKTKALGNEELRGVSSDLRSGQSSYQPVGLSTPFTFYSLKQLPFSAANRYPNRISRFA